ncbi:MAG: electron transport complex subunit E [Pseudomonadales bacterium]|nr:electron transport complex subunit E [Pseudomonadales bacterium]
MSNYSRIIKDGLWSKNVATVQVLGLCPLLAVTGSVVNAIGLGLATTAVLVGSNSLVSLIRGGVNDAIRLPVFVMIIAALTTCTEFIMQAYTFELFQILGIFIPLIVTNCCILGRADGFARKNPILPSILDGLMMGVGFMIVLILLGAFREMLGQGTLFANMDLIFGSIAESWTITIFEDFPGILFIALPPGAFFGLGLIIAIKDVINDKVDEINEQKESAVKAGSKRVRVTGHIS